VSATRRGLLPRLAQLGWRELRELWRAQCALIFAQLLVWSRPVGRLIVCEASSTAVAELPGPADDLLVEQIARALDRAARLGLFRPRCLVRALALHRSLEVRRVRGSIIRIGVRPSGELLLAHAWVEYRGRVLIDPAVAVSKFATLTAAREAGLPITRQ
jgi:hypothetical protein